MKETTSNRDKHYLPCSTLDEIHYLADLGPNQPLVFFCGFFIKGRLNHQTMKAALEASLETHDKCKFVLTRKVPSWKRWFRLYWEPHEVTSSDVLKILSAEELNIPLNKEPHHFLDMTYKHKIDLTREPGVKISLISQNEDNLLLFAFHHGITDGRGAIDFIETFVSEYNAIYFGKKTKSERRNKFTYFDNLFLPTWRQSLHIVKPFLSTLRHQYRFHREPLIRIVPKTPVPNEEKMVITRKIEGEELEKIMAFAKKRSVLFYDMLLAGLYFTIKKWNNRLGQSGTGRISFYSSTALRQRGNKSLGNFSSGVHINFPATDSMDKIEFLGNIAKKRIFLLKNSAYLLPLRLLSIFSLIPTRFRQGVVGWVLQRIRHGQSRRFATMRVTNLGTLNVDNFACKDEGILGDARLERSYLLPAVINKVPLLVCLTCNEKVYLNLVALTSTFSYESGKEFLSLLIQELSEF